jgi:predicted NAD/FAD-binding protein
MPWQVFKMGHPQFTPATTEAQADMADIQGVDGLWYAGAWMGHGFHEDGLRSGLQVGMPIDGTGYASGG